MSPVTAVFFVTSNNFCTFRSVYTEPIVITCYSTADDCAISEGEGWPAVRVPALTRPLAQSINLQPVTVKS